jgi:CRP-like cAMP-binding protein
MSDGKAVESATIGRESCAGLLDAVAEQPSQARIFVQIGGSATKIPAAAYRARFLQSPALIKLSLRHARASAIQAEQGVACNIAHGVEARLARWLLMTQDRVGQASFPLTQEYMAIMTGVQRSTVSVMAAQFKKQGLVDYTRGQLKILDRKALVGRSCECYGVIAEQFRGLSDRS